jgi:hypothetical protein
MRWTKLDLNCIYFFKKLNQLITTLNLHTPFVSVESTVLIFISFLPSKIYVSPTGMVSCLSHSQCRLCSSWRHHAVALCHVFFTLSQDMLASFASSSGNTLSHHLSSWAKTKILNLHHHRRLSSLDRSSPTLYYYKKIILILINLPTIQSHLYFTPSS